MAAVTSALAASFFGVAGTLIGAAVGSVISTVAGAMYAESLRRAGGRLKEVQTVVVQRVPNGTATQPAQLPSAQSLTQVIPTEADETIVLPAQDLVTSTGTSTGTGTGSATKDTAADGRHPGASGADLGDTSLIRPHVPRPWWRRPILTLPLVGVLGFVIAIAVITGIEGLTGNTLSGGSGTSLSKIGGSSAPAPTSTATVTVTSTAQPSQTATTTASPQESVPASATAPATEPATTATSAPSTSATAPVATAAPSTDSTDSSGAAGGAGPAKQDGAVRSTAAAN